jgi:hypothetical protein
VKRNRVHAWVRIHRLHLVHREVGVGREDPETLDPDLPAPDQGRERRDVARIDGGLHIERQAEQQGGMRGPVAIDEQGVPHVERHLGQAVRFRNQAVQHPRQRDELGLFLAERHDQGLARGIGVDLAVERQFIDVDLGVKLLFPVARHDLHVRVQLRAFDEQVAGAAECERLASRVVLDGDVADGEPRQGCRDLGAAGQLRAEPCDELPDVDRLAGPGAAREHPAGRRAAVVRRRQQQRGPGEVEAHRHRRVRHRA